MSDILALLSLLLFASGLSGCSSKAHTHAAQANAEKTAVPTTMWDKGQGKASAQARRSLISRFVVLRRPARPMPPSLVARVTSTVGIPADVSVDEPHVVYTALGAAWIANFGPITCLIEARHGAVSCTTTRRVARRGLALGSFKPPRHPRDRLSRFTVIGIAPDWVKTVVLRVGDEIRVVAVRHDTYAQRADRPITVERLSRATEAK